jgi:hypothetical protein
MNLKICEEGIRTQYFTSNRIFKCHQFEHCYDIFEKIRFENGLIGAQPTTVLKINIFPVGLILDP